jgi:DNA-directed RNA polymerase specialized sigma24 family protein
MTQPWTVEQIAARLAEAAQTGEQLPPVRVQGYFNTWPEFKRQPWELLAREDRPLQRTPPTPEAVDRMLEAMRWVQCLEVEQRHLVWMRAKGYPWRVIAKRFACDRSTAWRRWQRALTCLLDCSPTLHHP